MGWHQRFLPDGQHILSGAGVLEFDGEPLREHGHPVSGHEPVPMNNREVFYNRGDRLGARVFDLWTNTSREVYPHELSELAAGGGVLAGKDAALNVLVVIDANGGVKTIPNAGQPCIAADGAIIYRVGDDKIEPSICLMAEVWGDGRGKLFARFRGVPDGLDCTVGPHEARAGLIDTPEGPWVLCMAGPSLHLRPLFGSTGYEPPAHLVGDNRNERAHAVCVGREIRCVWQDTAGAQMRWTVNLDTPRKSLHGDVIVTTPPPPPPIEDEDSDVSTPQFLIDALTDAGHDIDDRFPGLREQDLEAWAKKTGRLAFLRRSEIGRKRNPSGRISPNAFGIKCPDGSLTAADIVRDNPATDEHPRGEGGRGPNEWRDQPEIDEGVEDDQEWIEPEPVDVGEGVPGPVDPPPPVEPPPPPPPSGATQLDRIEATVKATAAKIDRLLLVFRV